MVTEEKSPDPWLGCNWKREGVGIGVIGALTCLSSMKICNRNWLLTSCSLCCRIVILIYVCWSVIEKSPENLWNCFYSLFINHIEEQSLPRPIIFLQYSSITYSGNISEIKTRIAPHYVEEFVKMATVSWQCPPSLSDEWTPDNVA